LVAKYERLIQDSPSKKVASFWALKLARFHTRFRHDRKLAKKVLKEAISKDKVFKLGIHKLTEKIN